MSKLKLKEPITWKEDEVWHEVHHGAVEGVTVAKIFLSEKADTYGRLKASVLDGLRSDICGSVDQAKQRAEELLIEFAESIFTI